MMFENDQKTNESRKRPRTVTREVETDDGTLPLEINPEQLDRDPILIVPGFMSSGLQVDESEHMKNWTGKRLWLSLHRLGFTGKMLTEKVAIETADEDAQQVTVKNQWMNHVCLSSDLISERSGVKVRPVKGLQGVDYLDQSVFVKANSYVFGPVISSLKRLGGYTDGLDLDAVPYDWRVPPDVLEERDGYFTECLLRIERMYTDNGEKPVVLLAHSMGVKTGQYLLQFALREKGQDWIDVHVKTFITAGGPFLGSAQALRSVIQGTRMGLPSSILSDENAIVMGRSFGSSAWLLPIKPDGMINPEVSYSNIPYSPAIKKHGILVITLKSINCMSLFQAHFNTLPELKIRLKYEGHSLSSGWFKPTDFQSETNLNDILLEFPTAYNCAPQSTPVSIELLEKGKALVEKKVGERDSCKYCSLYCYCCFPCCIVTTLLQELGQGTKFLAENTADLTLKGMDSGVVIAKTAINLAVEASKVVHNAPIRLDPCHKNRAGVNSIVTIDFSYDTWETVLSRANIDLQARESKPKETTLTFSQTFMQEKQNEYQALTCFDVMNLERLYNHCNLWGSNHYAANPLITTRAPPVKNVVSVYGVNRKTEIQQLYARTARNKSTNKTLESRYRVDTKAYPKALAKSMGYSYKNGILYETKDTPQVSVVDGSIIKKSGDGTVPYASLQHVLTWHSHSCNVQTFELEGVEHREMLSDKEFHKILIDCCTKIKESELSNAIQEYKQKNAGPEEINVQVQKS